ncbi:hypothetical protein LJR143_002281 [Pseudoxanthomonas sp. LjRoot143]|uniref:hypothetical protein n=1 Tax=Pseudoxanthomonas sp. LjRoot143 TaxID=3342266 RepID=UPI003ECF8926
MSTSSTPLPKRRRRSWWRRLAWIVLILGAYPSVVLTYTWSHVLRSPLPGGRHGPLDAYRHTLASAVVAYTLDARAVRVVNRVMEGRGTRANAMDIHNNLIGAAIGSRVPRFSDIEPSVARSVASGRVDAPSSGQTTWLPPDEWKDGVAW